MSSFEWTLRCLLSRMVLFITKENGRVLTTLLPLPNVASSFMWPRRGCTTIYPFIMDMMLASGLVSRQPLYKYLPEIRFTGLQTHFIFQRSSDEATTLLQQWEGRSQEGSVMPMVLTLDPGAGGAPFLPGAWVGPWLHHWNCFVRCLTRLVEKQK